MKNQLLFSITGGVILFVWQVLSHVAPDFHSSSDAYTPHQDTILSVLKETQLESGFYKLGVQDPNSYVKPEKKKPGYNSTWARLNYRKNDSNDMLFPMIRTYVTDVLIAFFIFMMLKNMNPSSLRKKLFLATGVGLIGFLYLSYSDFIWYKSPDIWAYFFDSTIPFILLGLFAHSVLPKQEEIDEEYLELEDAN